MNQTAVLPNGTLLVGFDFTHGEGNKILIVGSKEGETLNIINAFQGKRAEEIFRILTTIENRDGKEHRTEPWTTRDSDEK